MMIDGGIRLKTKYTNKKGIVLGGDLRQVHLANRLSQYMEIIVAGIEQADEMLLSSATKATGPEGLPLRPDFLFLPMPVMSGEYINAPMSPDKISLHQALKHAGQNTVVFGGKIDPPMQRLLEDHEIRYYDYLEREELAVMNAIATAEGTIEIILRELPVTIFGLSVMIIGSGRISKTLRHWLTSLGAQVSVSARSHADLAWIAIDGCTPIPMKEMERQINHFDVIINTVPAKILDENILSCLTPSALLIDLASKPGGVDFEEANRLGIRTIWALSLPGKTAPISSGEIIYRTICHIIEEDISKT